MRLGSSISSNATHIMTRLTAGLRELTGIGFASVTRQRPRIATVSSRNRMTKRPWVPTGSALAAGRTSDPSHAKDGGDVDPGRRLDLLTGGDEAAREVR